MEPIAHTAPWTDTVRRGLVEAIHATDHRLVLCVAGGGNAVITDLLDVAGASRTVLEVRVPYARTALDELVASDETIGPNDGAVSAPMAAAMARASRVRAQRLVDGSAEDDRLLGVACTAALVTDRTRRGDHRAHIAVADAGGVVLDRLELSKGDLDRKGEDRVVADAVLTAIAAAMGITTHETR